jgi:hypothetical protein
MAESDMIIVSDLSNGRQAKRRSSDEKCLLSSFE